MEQSDSKVVMELTERAYTMDMWPHAFKLQYSVTLEDDRLATDFCVTNTDSKPLSFTGALHTYWSCDDIDKVAIKAPAFAGATYLDKMQSPPADVKSASDTISIGAPVDSVYAGVSGDVVLEGAHASPLTIKNSVGWSDTVVWSPWGSPPSTARRSPPAAWACWCGSGPRSAERRGRSTATIVSAEPPPPSPPSLDPSHPRSAEGAPSPRHRVCAGAESCFRIADGMMSDWAWEPERVTEALARAATSRGAPPAEVTIGADARFGLNLLRHLPAAALETVIWRWYASELVPPAGASADGKGRAS